VFSGHYHEHQTLGNVTYIGNPYSLGYGEAGHPDKGIIVVYKDHSFDLLPLNIAKHLNFNLTAAQYHEMIDFSDMASVNSVFRADFLGAKVRIQGSQKELESVDYKKLKDHLAVDELRLDLIPTDKSVKSTISLSPNMPDADLLDKCIDELPGDPQLQLKALWRELK
jgi:hypothetical protein